MSPGETGLRPDRLTLEAQQIPEESPTDKDQAVVTILLFGHGTSKNVTLIWGKGERFLRIVRQGHLE